MISAYRQWRQYRRVLLDRHQDEYDIRLVTEPVFVAAARRLHAAVYLHRGYVPAEAVSKSGQLKVAHDPYQRHAAYFVVTRQQDGRPNVVATARQIMVDPAQAHRSFPTFRHLRLFARYRQAIEQLDPAQCVEISALARRRGESMVVALLLYRAMWQHSLAAGHQRWLMACDQRLYRRLKQLFGPAITQVGPPAFYLGSQVVPAMVDITASRAWVVKVATNRNPLRNRLRWLMARFLLEGEKPA